MKHFKRIIQSALVGAALCATFMLSGSSQVAWAQSKATESVRSKGGRDPFIPYRPPVKVKKAAANMIATPTIQERVERYKAQKMAAMNAQLPAPKPTTAFLLSETQVIGIFRTPRGYAAMVEVTPIKLSYTIYPGEMFYDGQLVAIEEDRLVFRRVVRWSDGRREMTVETKPLRKPNPVTDSMSASKNTSAKTPAAEPVKSVEEKKAAPEKQ